MCGGNYLKWLQPRQLIKICGEPIVARTIRLLRECGVDDIAISTDDERFATLGVPILTHNNEYLEADGCRTGCWVNGFYPMDEPACYILGDVVFSPEAIMIIVSMPVDRVEFFASAPPFAPEYIKDHAEPFAFKVHDQKLFREAINYCRDNATTGIFGRHPIAWELWQVIKDKPVNEIDFYNYVAINDYTCDVDHEKDARRIEAVLCGS